MKTMLASLALLLATGTVSAAEIVSRVEKPSSQEFNIRCDNGNNITVVYRYPNDTYQVNGRYFSQYREAVAFGCK